MGPPVILTSPLSRVIRQRVPRCRTSGGPAPAAGSPRAFKDRLTPGASHHSLLPVPLNEVPYVLSTVHVDGPSPRRVYGRVRAGKGATPAASTGRWVVKTSVSRMDDSQTVALSLAANRAVSGWPGTVSTPRLMLRCQEGEVSAYVATGLRPDVEYGNTSGATVTVRFDKNPAQELNTSQSTDGEALFFEEPKGMIRTLLLHQVMLFRFTPFNSAPQETSFTLRGLAQAIKPLETACGWSVEADEKAEQERRRAEWEAASKKEDEDRAADARRLPERIAALKEQSVPVRARAARDIGSMAERDVPGVEMAVPRLLELAGDEAQLVRERVAWALGQIGAAEAVPTLERLANDPVPIVAKNAKEALTAVRARQTKPPQQ